MDIIKWNEVFDKYVEKYDISNKDLLYKYNHTYRVCKNSRNICDSLNLSKEQKQVAYLIALLHDIGRFYQNTVYNSYFDAKNFDHADYGVKILFEEKLIRQFVKENVYDRFIYLGVKNHNKWSVEENLTQEELLQCNIVRDSDKLDILRNAITISKINKKENDNSDISEKVKEEFFSHRMVNKNYRKTNNDAVVTLLSQIYDLNFCFSFKCIKENGYIENIYKEIKNKQIFKIYFDEINKYIDERCNDVRN